jgi:outer membrane protein OmpA-like peptidoglycan-associated protein
MSRRLLFTVFVFLALPMQSVATTSLVAPCQNVGALVFFDFNDAALSPDAKATLDRQVYCFFHSNPKMAAVIEGHADKHETQKQGLGLKRAAVVRDYLIASGVGSDQLSVVSYGSKRPLRNGSSKDDREINRRAVTVPQTPLQ